MRTNLTGNVSQLATGLFMEGEGQTRRKVLASGFLAAMTLAGANMTRNAGAMNNRNGVDVSLQTPIRPMDANVPEPRLVNIAPDSVKPIPSLKAEAFIAADGTLLAGNNYDKPMVPASQTKTVFAPGFFEALLSGRLTPDTKLTFQAHHIAQHEVNGPKFRFVAGDTLTVKQAALLTFNHSHNAVANLLAEAAFGGDMDAALDFANKWTLECWREHGYEGQDFMGRFFTPHGLTRRVGNGAGAADLPLEQQNRTTVLELLTYSRVMDATYRDIVNDYFGIPVFSFAMPRLGEVKVFNSNRLLEGNPRPPNAGAEPVAGVVGGKTGLTDLSGASLQFHYESPGTGAEYFGMFTGAQGPGRVVAAAHQAKRVLVEGLKQALLSAQPLLVSVDAPPVTGAGTRTTALAPRF